MTKVKLFFYVLTISVFLISCSEDDSDPVENSSIVGEWRMTEYNGFVDTSTDSDYPIVNTITVVGSNFDCVTTFTENPNLVSSTGKFDINIQSVITMAGVEVYNVSQDTTADYDEAGNEEVSWNIINENELVTPLLIPEDLPEGININFDEITTEIVELTSSTLKLKLSGEITVTESGVTTVTGLEYLATYARQ